MNCFCRLVAIPELGLVSGNHLRLNLLSRVLSQLGVVDPIGIGIALAIRDRLARAANGR